MAVPTQFAYRTLKEIGITDAAPVYEPLPGFKKPQGNSRCSVYSPDGRYFAYTTNESVVVVETYTGHVVTTLNIPMVYELGFSPKGSYLITWERPSKDENGDAVKNLKVWRTVEDVEEGAEKAVVGRFVQKNQTGWNLQYTADEKYCARVVTNEVQFYQAHDLGTVWNKLRAEGVQDFKLSPGNNQNIAIFVPERKVSLSC
jgi:translation initiation factor 2A